MKKALVVAILFSVANNLSAVEFEKEVVYANKNGQELKLDLALPDDGELRPCVMCIHGGGWRGGKRQSQQPFMKMAAEHGMVAVTVDYRLTTVAPWPAQVEDVKAALNWIVDNADKYKIDVERIAVLGQSAGAHLSLMLGAMPEETKESRRVRGVINFFGPADMTDVSKIEHARGTVEMLVG